MALPDNPLTRGEQYLNRIATGEGTIPDEPLTRMEQYLDYIAENGGGDGDPEAIASAVTDWLEENVDPVGSAVVVDSSLTVSGAAADAKVTGDKLSEFIDTSYLTFSDDVMENSNFIYNNGAISVTHATSPYNFCAFEVSSISFYWKRPNSAYQLYVGVYDSASNSFIGQNIAAVATKLYKLTGSAGSQFTDFSDLVSTGFEVTSTAVKFVATITGNHFSLTQGDTTILAFTLPSAYTVSGIGFMNYQIANLTEARKNISIKSKINALSDEVTALQNSVSNVDIINNGKRHKMIAGVIRNSGSGWEFIVNDQHAGDMNCTGIGTLNGDIKVTYYSATGGKVVSVVICPDETLTSLGYTIGTSVAASYFIASIYRRKPDAVSGTIGYSGGAFSVGNNANGVTGVNWDSTNSRLQITHSQITDGTSSVINAQSYRYGTAIPRVYSVSATSVTLEFVNPATGEKLTEPSNAMEIWFSRSSSTSFASEKIDADTLVSANGNFWFIGIMELPE